MRQCPFDSTLIGVSSLDALPVNTALLQLIGSGEVPARCFVYQRIEIGHM